MALFGKSEERQQLEDLEELRQEVLRAQMPGSVEAVALRELEKLEKTPVEAAEYTIGINHLEYLVSLPWGVHTKDNLDLARAERVLNEQHAGLHQVKARILEYLAVRTLKLQRKPRLMVVDDEEIARTNLQHILEKEGYEVATATNGVEALEQMNSAGFELVLTDLRMLELGGMELLERIKSRHVHTEVVIITGYASVDSALEAVQKGAYHYLSKPLKIDEVRTIVKQALAEAQWELRPKGPVFCFSGPPGTGKTSLG
ncbi:MAG: response regulator, partial [Dehalococcoidia bacterium]